MSTRALRHCYWLAVALLLALGASRTAGAQTVPNVVTTLPPGTVGGTPSYLPETDNLVALLQEDKLTKLNDRPAVKVACPPSAPGVDCYTLILAAGATSFKFEYIDGKGNTKKGSVTVTLPSVTPPAPPTSAPPVAPAPPTPAPAPPVPAAQANFPPPRGCPSRPATVLEYAYREAVIKSKITGHECDEPATVYERGQDIAILLFDETGSPIGPLPKLDEDDRVFIVVASDQGADQNPKALVKDLRVVTCEEPQQVRIGGSAKAPSGVHPNDAGTPPTTDPSPYFRLAWASGCSSDSGIKASVTVTDTDTAAKTTSSTISVPTLSLYRITVGLGVVYDISKESEFRAASVKGESVPEIVQDEHTRGLQVLALVSLRLERVDTARPRLLKRPLNWISPTVGISLTHPLDHIYAGFLFDPVPGLGVVAGMHFRREPSLAGGFQVGDRVPSGQVATDLRWHDVDFGRDYFIGLDLDAAVIANILKGIAQ